MVAQQHGLPGAPPPPPPPAAPAAAGLPHLSRAQLLFWIPFACVQPVCVALLGVLTRYLQFETVPTWPACRLITFLCFISTPLTILLHLGPSWAAAAWRRCGSSAVGGQRGESAKESSARGSRSVASMAALDAPTAGTTAPNGGWQARHPRLYRTCAAFAIAVAQSWVLVLMVIAPRLVDASVTQLVSMFTVVGVAAVGKLWLGLPVPRPLYVAAPIMLGGACMVVVPNILTGTGPGSLTTGSAWLGFAASVGVWLGLVVFISLVQAFKPLGISPFEVMHWVNAQCLLLFLPLSLGLDGTDWAAQFAGMGSLDWAYLFLAGSVGILGMIILSQIITINLGGLTLAMFFSLRFLASIVLSKLLLGSTIVSSGLQVAGVVLVAGSLTAYMALQWWAARARELAAAQAAAAGEGEGKGAFSASSSGCSSSSKLGPGEKDLEAQQQQQQQQQQQAPSRRAPPRGTAAAGRAPSRQRSAGLLEVRSASVISDTGLELGGVVVTPYLEEELSRRLTGLAARLSGRSWRAAAATRPPPGQPAEGTAGLESRPSPFATQSGR